MGNVVVGKLFPEMVIASISTGLLIATLMNKPQRHVLPAILFVTSFFSAVAGIIRYFANVSIERRCTWQRPTLSSHISRSNRTVTADAIFSHPDGTCAITSTTSDVGYDTENTDNATVRNTQNTHHKDHKDHIDHKDNPETITGFFLWLQASTISLSDDAKDTQGQHNITADIEIASVSESDSPYDNNHGNSRVTTRQWSHIVKSFLHPSPTTFMLLHGPAVTLILYLTARLFAVTNFQTNPVDLDFGYSYKSAHNLAFVSGTQSRSLLGFLSAFLSFPAVSGTLVRSVANFCPQGTNTTDKSMGTNCVRIIMAITTFTYSILTFYPTYIFIKSLIAGGEDHHKVFASSYYASKCSEWVAGYVVGVVEGMFVTSIVMRLVVVDLPKQHEGGLVAYMKTFEVTIRKPKTQREMEEEWQQQLNQRRSGEAGEEWNDHEQNEEETTRPSSTVVAEKTERKYAFGKLEEYTMTRSNSWSCDFYHLDILAITRMLSIIPLSMFMLSTPICGICMGATWNLCKDNVNDCINSKVDWSYTLSFISPILFVVIEGIIYWVVKSKYEPFKCC